MSAMSRAAALLMVIVCWAAIYLPALGSLEIRGEEGRRILPAVAMLDTGDFLVPQVGGEPYYRKPPLVNWVVAASFKLTGVRNEWTARLPSVLCVLAVALAFVTVASASLGANGSLFAALIWLANVGMVEKGRLIEIEALYVSLFGLALIFWLSWWRERRSAWLTWTVPWLFLGLGILAKGPLHLFFFYAVVLALFYREGGLRQLLRGPHLIGIVLMAAVFAAWAYPYWREMSHANVPAAWSRQLTGRFTGDDFKLGNWLLNIPRGLAYFLPWTLLLPAIIKVKWAQETDRKLAWALGWGAAIPFCVVNLLPGGLPRYALPALVPACWLVAMMLDRAQITWRGKAVGAGGRFRLVMAVAIFAVLLVGIYSLAVVPVMQQRPKVKSIAAHVDNLVPDSEPLYALDPDFQPFLFYVKSRLIYADSVEAVPASARYLLIQPEMEEFVLKSERWAPLRAKAVERFTDYRNHTTILVEVGAR
jgi:4-amino-4-deoxy-L-arabinose transferase-like glycosyltransferase